MPLEKFTFATVGEMDGGRIATAFEQALKRLEFDCIDRPALETPRKLVLTVTLTPCTDGGELDSVDVSFKFKESIPERGSKSYNMKAVPGGLIFNDASPEDVNQKTLDMAPKIGAQKQTSSWKEKTDVG